jgi:DNA-binding response OmpR family regulator
MPNLDILSGKRILAVDDEPDILEVIKEQLVLCHVTVALDAETAKSLILSEQFDLVILDIMGVEGFTLLELSTAHHLPAAMLTAQALTAESVKKSLRLGAVSFLPKDELVRLPELVAEIFGELAEGRSHWRKLFHRLGPWFSERLGLTWEDLERPRTPPYIY